jgi:hypothetical protein
MTGSLPAPKTINATMKVVASDDRLIFSIFH